jgi:hypothetical protein
MTCFCSNPTGRQVLAVLSGYVKEERDYAVGRLNDEALCHDWEGKDGKPRAIRKFQRNVSPYARPCTKAADGIRS